VNGLAVKFRRHETCHLGERVEPFGDLFTFAAIFQAAIDLLADGLGQPRDFAVSSHRVFSFFGFIHLHSPSFSRVGEVEGGGFERTAVVSPALPLRPSSNRTDGFPIFGSPNSFIFQPSSPPWSAVHRVHIAGAIVRVHSVPTGFGDSRVCATASAENGFGCSVSSASSPKRCCHSGNSPPSRARPG